MVIPMKKNIIPCCMLKKPHSNHVTNLADISCNPLMAKS